MRLVLALVTLVTDVILEYVILVTAFAFEFGGFDVAELASPTVRKVLIDHCWIIIDGVCVGMTRHFFPNNIIRYSNIVRLGDLYSLKAATGLNPFYPDLFRFF